MACVLQGWRLTGWLVSQHLPPVLPFCPSLQPHSYFPRPLHGHSPSIHQMSSDWPSQSPDSLLHLIICFHCPSSALQYITGPFPLIPHQIVNVVLCCWVPAPKYCNMHPVTWSPTLSAYTLFPAQSLLPVSLTYFFSDFLPMPVSLCTLQVLI